MWGYPPLEGLKSGRALQNRQVIISFANVFRHSFLAFYRIIHGVDGCKSTQEDHKSNVGGSSGYTGNPGDSTDSLDSLDSLSKDSSFFFGSHPKEYVEIIVVDSGETLSEVLDGKIQYNAILRMAKPQYEGVPPLDNVREGQNLVFSRIQQVR